MSDSSPFLVATPDVSSEHRDLESESGLHTVLLAEDDPDYRFLIREAFASAGLPVRTEFMSDGQELLDYLRKESRFQQRTEGDPSLILLDLEMPGLGGLETLAQLRTDPRLARIPTVILTSSTEGQDFQRAYSSGARSFLTKPDSFKMLVRYIKSLSHHLARPARPIHRTHILPEQPEKPRVRKRERIGRLGREPGRRF